MSINIKLRDIIILALLLIIGLNYAFYKYAYSGFIRKRFELQNKITQLQINNADEISKFHSKMDTFDKIINIDNNIKDIKVSTAKLKKETQTKENVSDILKTLLLSTNMKTKSLNVENVNIKNNQLIQTFNIKATGSLPSVVEFMQNIENKGNILSIENYSLSFNENNMNFNATVNAVSSGNDDI
ncbi:MAG: hypothetical protein FXF49_11405 [Flexistipes sinusarabici]|uniref:Uncharacterized protein n=1 Tax=Flexistipes sinusarabici TaxID=2352 RepID=A0A5D0MJB1_FLESI|nr:hypothetical protein [Flexistipes sinusarabici]TYB32462.1 MAG: hypothetical protein FXF49_11405 [Flexistipes sinusarabici]